MKEAFLHHLWNHKLFDQSSLTTFHGSPLEIIHFGTLNSDAGPDFYEAEIVVGQQLWVGCVEMHINSSDWDLHHHSQDKAYQNVILHVVWNHDREVEEIRARNVETLILRDYVPKEIVFNYEQIMHSNTDWLRCKSLIHDVEWDKISFWFERLFIERLEEKSMAVFALYERCHKNWEELTFKLLASNFGLKINQGSFEIWANSFPYTVVQQNQRSTISMESLFFGQAGFLEDALDDYQLNLKEEYSFLRRKFNLNPVENSMFKFSSLRPLGFPTIRLAQLASIYEREQNLFSKLLHFQTLKELEYFFETFHPHDYWTTHYNFGKERKAISKKIARTKIHNLVINTIIPLRFLYEKLNDQVDVEFYISILEAIKAEKNAIVDHFVAAKFPIQHAKDSQLALHLKKWFCDEKKCLNCAIGNEVLKQ